MKRFGLALALICLAASGMTASAQDKYPSRPVKIIVPYAPGGATDITARLFGEQMRQSLGQQFVVESKPGAFGILLKTSRRAGQIAEVLTSHCKRVIMPQERV